MSEKKQEFCRGFVKQVLSGDTVTISRPPRNGPPEVKTIHLDSVTAPKLGRKLKDGEMKDEPYAWQSREFLRKKIIGQAVLFTASSHGSASQLYGSLILGPDPNKGEDVIATMISEGWLTVKNTAPENYKKLEEQAKAAKKGMHKEDKGDSIRDIKWAIEDVKDFVEKRRNKPIKAVIENIRDGSTVHAFLLPDFYRATVMIHGIRAPGFGRSDADSNVPPQIAEEAKFFVECRLLNRDVEITLMDFNGPNLVGSIRLEKGNHSIAEAVVKEGFAKVVRWSLKGMKPSVAAALQAAENEAKSKRLRIWKDYVPTNTSGGKEYTATVVEIVNADALVVKLNDGKSKKIFLSSIRPPKEKPVTAAAPAPAPAPGAVGEAAPEKPPPPPPVETTQAAPVIKGKPRPLYDIPYMFEAREFLRQKLIGKKVSIIEDYVQQAFQAANNSTVLPEKVCCTVTIGGVNVAEALVSKGLATVVRHRNDDDQRSPYYDALIAAESKAIKSGHGMYSKKPPPVLRVVEISDAAKAKSFLRYMRGTQDAIVEYVSSGSRFRLFLPKETRIISFLLAGVSCQRTGRPGAQETPSEYGEEATLFTRERCMQRDVKITVESISMANFTGYLFVDGLNLAVALAEEGLASVHFSAEKSEHFRALKAAEDRAKERKLRIWKDWKEREHVEKTSNDDNDAEAALESLPPGVEVIITEFSEIHPDIIFYAQSVEQGPKLEKLAESMRHDFQASPPIPGTYTPKKGDLCAAKFVDGEWYRAKVEKVERGTIAHVLYVDYGNRHQVPVTDCAALPPRFTSDKFFAEQYALAGVQLLSDADYIDDAKNFFKEQAMNVTLKLSVVLNIAGITYATLINPTNNVDLAERLLSEGYVVKKIVKKMPLPLRKLYDNAHETAKKERIGVWRYGDIMAEDAKEFGVRKEA